MFVDGEIQKVSFDVFMVFEIRVYLKEIVCSISLRFFRSHEKIDSASRVKSPLLSIGVK